MPNVSTERHELTVGFCRITSSHRILTVGKDPQHHQIQPPAHPHAAVSHVPKCHISTSCAGRALCARCVVHTRCAVQLPALHSWERVSVCRGACIHKGVRPGRRGASSGAAERSGGGSGAWQVGSCRQERGSRMPGSRWCEQPVRAKRPGLGWPGGRRGEGREWLPVRTRSPRLDRARCRSPGETPAARPGSVPAGCFGAAVVPRLSTKFVPEQSKRGTCTDGETEAFFAGNSSDSSRMSSPLKKESSNRQLLLSCVCSRLSRTRRVRSPHPITAAISPRLLPPSVPFPRCRIWPCRPQSPPRNALPPHRRSVPLLLLLAALLAARPFLTPCPLGCRPSFATDSGLIHPWQSYLSLSQHLCCCQP